MFLKRKESNFLDRGDEFVSDCGFWLWKIRATLLCDFFERLGVIFLILFKVLLCILCELLLKSLMVNN